MECLDATGAITALHVSESGVPEGWKHRDVDKEYNRKLAPRFTEQYGNTACLPSKLSRIRNVTSSVRNVTSSARNVPSASLKFAVIRKRVEVKRLCRELAKETVIHQGDISADFMTSSDYMK